MPSRRHHFLPQFYLRRFVDSDGQLWQFDLKFLANPNPHRCSPRDAGVERDLYAPLVGPEPVGDSVEHFLADQVDGLAAPVVETLCSGNDLSDSEHQALARFVVAQRFRTPAIRDQSLRDATGKANRQLEEWSGDRASMESDIRQAYERMDRTEVEAEAEIDLWNRLMDTGEPVSVEATKPFWLNRMIQGVEAAACYLQGLDYHILEPPPGTEFLTTDTPVLRRYAHPLLRECLGEPGWRSPGSEITLPLSPDHLLLIGHTIGEPLDLRGWWEQWRKDMVEKANRFAIARGSLTDLHLQLALGRYRR